MAEVNCNACDELKNEVPELTVNGLDDNMCTSLKNNMGLKASSGHDNYTDLNNLNDCLVGNMAVEIDTVDVCDLKDFLRDLIGNIWTAIKAVNCAISGLWTKVDAAVSSATTMNLSITGNTLKLSNDSGDLSSVVLPSGFDAVCVTHRRGEGEAPVTQWSFQDDALIGRLFIIVGYQDAGNIPLRCQLDPATGTVTIFYDDPVVVTRINVLAFGHSS